MENCCPGGHSNEAYKRHGGKLTCGCTPNSMDSQHHLKSLARTSLETILGVWIYQPEIVKSQSNGGCWVTLTLSLNDIMRYARLYDKLFFFGTLQINTSTTRCSIAGPVSNKAETNFWAVQKPLIFVISTTKYTAYLLRSIQLLQTAQLLQLRWSVPGLYLVYYYMKSVTLS